MQKVDVKHLLCVSYYINIVGGLLTIGKWERYPQCVKKGKVTRTKVSTDTSAQTSRVTCIFILSITEHSFKAISDLMFLNYDASMFLKNSIPILVVQKKRT